MIDYSPLWTLMKEKGKSYVSRWIAPQTIFYNSEIKGMNQKWFILFLFYSFLK